MPQDAPFGPATTGYATMTRTLRLDGQDYRIRSLTDRQQYANPGHRAERLGISSAQWSTFGQVWPAGRLLSYQRRTGPGKQMPWTNRHPDHLAT